MCCQQALHCRLWWMVRLWYDCDVCAFVHSTDSVCVCACVVRCGACVYVCVYVSVCVCVGLPGRLHVITCLSLSHSTIYIWLFFWINGQTSPLVVSFILTFICHDVMKMLTVHPASLPYISKEICLWFHCSRDDETSNELFCFSLSLKFCESCFIRHFEWACS